MSLDAIEKPVSNLELAASIQLLTREVSELGKLVKFMSGNKSMLREYLTPCEVTKIVPVSSMQVYDACNKGHLSRRDNGRPLLILHGAAARHARERGVRRVHLALTHTSDVAAATVTLEGVDAHDATDSWDGEGNV
jgi:hypothetical protein